MSPRAVVKKRTLEVEIPKSIFNLKSTYEVQVLFILQIEYEKDKKEGSIYMDTVVHE